jgi:hypothetical protein
MTAGAKRTISIIAYQRPALFAQLLHSLVRNDLSGWRVEIQLEPSEHVATFRGIASSLLGRHDHAIRVNEAHLGIDRNSFTLLERLFAQGSQLNIYLEEDLVVAPDICALALWYWRNHRPHWFCLSLMSGFCGSAGFLSDMSHPDVIFEARAFNSLGFIQRRQEWKRLAAPRWMKSPDQLITIDRRSVGGWDWSIAAMLAMEPSVRALHPVAARARHTGREGGVHCSPEFHDLAFARLPVSGTTGPLAYRLVECGDLPSPARGHAIIMDELVRAQLAMGLQQRMLDQPAVEA